MRFKSYRKLVEGNKVIFEVQFDKITDESNATIEAYRVVKAILGSFC